MQITVKFFASHREITGQRETTVDLPDGSRVSDLIDTLVRQYPGLAERLALSSYAVNQEFAPDTAPLRDLDEVALLPPMSGGDDGRYRVVRDPIDPNEVARQVITPAIGAVVVFIGTVRETSRGKTITHLVYEAYEEMAVRRLRQVGDEIRERWDLDQVAITHRVGRMDLEEISVAIAVAAPHRKAAFRACEYAIDRLKEIVPIWKEEHATDGHTWIEGQS